MTFTALGIGRRLPDMGRPHICRRDAQPETQAPQCSWTSTSSATLNNTFNYYLNNGRPKEWNRWPEIALRDRKGAKFTGNKPHSWTASDFIRAARSLFVYERERDSALRNKIERPTHSACRIASDH